MECMDHPMIASGLGSLTASAHLESRDIQVDAILADMYILSTSLFFPKYVRKVFVSQ